MTKSPNKFFLYLLYLLKSNKFKFSRQITIWHFFISLHQTSCPGNKGKFAIVTRSCDKNKLDNPCIYFLENVKSENCWFLQRNSFIQTDLECKFKFQIHFSQKPWNYFFVHECKLKWEIMPYIFCSASLNCSMIKHILNNLLNNWLSVV